MYLAHIIYYLSQIGIVVLKTSMLVVNQLLICLCSPQSFSCQLVVYLMK